MDTSNYMYNMQFRPNCKSVMGGSIGIHLGIVLVRLPWVLHSHQLSPKYEGQLMSDGGAYSPFRSILLVLTHDFIIICVYGPTGSDGHEWMVLTRTLVAHHFWPFEAKRVLYAWGPVQPANGPPTRTTSG